MTLAAIALLLTIYHSTFIFMVNTWLNSSTFQHCFLIFPISGYLIWQRRQVLADLVPCPDYRPLFFLALFGFGWLLGYLADVMVFQQFAMVAMIPMLVWAILGWRVVNEIAFPLVFLLFSVPVGDFLIPRMIDFTANFTVGMLKMTGIPVYREGSYFSIPSGDWSVIEACSGLRYLIASITLGSLFAYITYRSTKRRLLFIALSIVVPIIANGFRAYMIVMIGHLSNMTLAVGIDHFIYGWVFFGIVMTIKFWLGSKWREDQVVAPGVQPNPSIVHDWKAGRTLTVGLCALMISAVWPVRAGYIDNLDRLNSASLELSLPEPKSPWRLTESMTNWVPGYTGADIEKQGFYTDGHYNVAIFLRYYQRQEQGRELVSSLNVLLPQEHALWKMPEEKLSTVTLAGSETKILQGRLQSKQQELLTWRWNWISEQHTANDYLAKILQARDKLLGRRSGQAGIILAVEVRDDISDARAALQNFVDLMLPSIEHSLRRVQIEGNG